MEIIIFGAHLIALECARWIEQIGLKHKILGFAVTEKNGNPKSLLGFPVRTLEEYKRKSKNSIIILALPERYHNEVQQYVLKNGFNNFYRLGLGEMSKLKGAQLIASQHDLTNATFILKEDDNDPTWLNIAERQKANNIGRNEILHIRHYKFPTLFYLEEKEMLEKTLSLDFFKDYEKVCGYYQNLHTLSGEDITKKNRDELRKIINIYMVFSKWDLKKIDFMQDFEPWVYPIQVGSKPSEQEDKHLSDNIGDSISGYNSLFAEMTGAYWIWKNRTNSKYKGLCHYRRHFIISEREISLIEKNDIDVILTTPRYVPGGVKKMFLEETPVKSKVYKGMLCAISELYPDDIENFEVYMNRCFYYPNNMVIAKNDIYDSYCSWVFPILFHMKETDAKTCYGHENDRHIAYAAELLTSYYFVRNKERYHIVVIDYKLTS